MWLRGFVGKEARKVFGRTRKSGGSFGGFCSTGGGVGCDGENDSATAVIEGCLACYCSIITGFPLFLLCV